MSAVYTPPRVVVSGTGLSFGYSATAHVYSVEQYAGEGVGSARIGYPSHYAANANPQMGHQVELSLGGRVIFRGIVGHVLTDIDSGRDDVALVLFDDKLQLSYETIGRVGVGTKGSGDRGFQDVGFQIIFNRDGRPNRGDSYQDFNTGSDAEYWTLKDILRFVFRYYVSSAVATLGLSELSAAYDRMPSHVDLTGQTVLEAIGTIVELAGQSWTLRPASGKSEFKAVRPGGGSARKARLFQPKGGASAASAMQTHADEVSGANSIRSCRDHFQVKSGPTLKEHTYTSSGADPLLTRATSFADPEYAARYQVDVTKYSSHGLGEDLSSGAIPKPLIAHLLTRRKADGSAYITAAEIDADPTLLDREQMPKPFVWLSADGTEGNARLVVGNMRMDLDQGTIDFKGVVELATQGGEKEEVTIADWSNVEVWATVVTVLEYPETSETEEVDSYLPRAAWRVITKSDLTPELRESVWLPDISGSNPNTVSKVAESGEETYVDVSERLEAVRDAELAASPAIETPFSARFPFMPTLQVGDRLAPAGRNLGTSADTVITSLTYRFDEGAPSYVQAEATNVTAAVDPERFVEGE